MYELLKERFSQQFGKTAEAVFSAPGRTELSGNHTDHQHGCVLAAAVNLDALAAVAQNDAQVIRVLSEGYPLCEIALNDLSIHPEETGSTAAIIRGVAARFTTLGCKLGGFDAYITSRVLPGSGLSSSAAFEVLIGTICNHLFFEQKLSAVEIAQVGQYAENVYFGKPCGLMDQTASSVGNIIGIDFADPADPKVTPIPFDFTTCGYALCIIDSGAGHADLTDEYAAIPNEMKAVARCLGREVLSEVGEAEFYAHLEGVRKVTGDRACLRAIHYFEENKRVRQQVRALLDNDFAGFLRHVTESGRSSWMYLQNVIPAGYIGHQELAFSLALAESLLGGQGACRVHGGGFAGTIQAFVPNEMLEDFRAGIERVLGEGSCHVLSIRHEGGVRLE